MCVYMYIHCICICIYIYVCAYIYVTNVYKMKDYNHRLHVSIFGDEIMQFQKQITPSTTIE